MKLMIVESPNKTKKIASELGQEWKVLASFGHVRDLPDAIEDKRELPALDAIGIDSETFALTYRFIPSRTVEGHYYPGGEDHVAPIRSAAARASEIFLATDPDREGEAIAWHLTEALHLKESAYRRVAFHEVNGRSIRDALTKARKLDLALVHAQEARRGLDRMVGYLVSPLLSHYLGRTISVGRVQSVAVRLVVEREREIRTFASTQHFGAEVTFANCAWRAEWVTTPLTTSTFPYILDPTLASGAADCRAFRVIESSCAIEKELPPKPLSTSLMLRAASIILGFDPDLTTKLAQRLFEQGAITYIRTDSVNLGTQAIEEVRSLAKAMGMEVPDSPRHFRAKEGAQEAHEAIRPTDISIETAGETDDELSLYRLIRRRTIASQLSDARYSVNTLVLQTHHEGQASHFKARGRRLIDRGWRALSATDAGEEEREQADACCGEVPLLDVGTELLADGGRALTKHTKAPNRYSKATLIAKLEDEGIGRPATYSSIIKTIMTREYLREEAHLIVPSELGEHMIEVLVKAGFSFMDIAYTRRFEQQLDAVAEGRIAYQDVLADAYRQLRDELQRFAQGVGAQPRFPCPHCGHGLLRYGQATDGGYWHCSNADCGQFLDDVGGVPVERAKYPCPKCAASLRRYQRRDGHGHLWACPTKDCHTFLDDDDGRPVEFKSSPCPKCQRAMYRHKNKNGVGYWWGCSGYKDGCDYTAEDLIGSPRIDAASREGKVRDLRLTRRRGSRR